MDNDGGVRTTLDLPEDLLERARAIARDTQRGVESVVADLMRRGLAAGTVEHADASAWTGLPPVSVGRVATSDDVGALENEGPEGR